MRNCIDCGKPLVPGSEWPESYQRGKIYRHKTCDAVRNAEGDALKNRACVRLGISPRKDVVSNGVSWRMLPKERRKAELTYQRELDATNGITTETPAREKFTHPQLPRIEAEQKKRYSDADSAEARARDGFVYTIGHNLWPDYVKIGKARNPNKRLADANTWCPEGSFFIHDAVYDADAVTLERSVHAAAKARGTQLDGEWFRLNRWHAVNLIRKVQRDDIDSRSGRKWITS